MLVIITSSSVHVLLLPNSCLPFIILITSSSHSSPSFIIIASAPSLSSSFQDHARHRHPSQHYRSTSSTSQLIIMSSPNVYLVLVRHLSSSLHLPARHDLLLISCPSLSSSHTFQSFKIASSSSSFILLLVTSSSLPLLLLVSLVHPPHLILAISPSLPPHLLFRT